MMNVKLLSASLVGIGSIGSAVAGGFYLFNKDYDKHSNSRLEKSPSTETLLDKSPSLAPTPPQTSTSGTQG